jgi:DNA processing protein
MPQVQPNSEGIDNWLRLIRSENVGPTTFLKLLKYFGTVENALGASVSQLCKVEGIGAKTAETITASRNKFNVEAELELAEKNDVWIIHIKDERYPKPLRKIYDPPPILYIRGALSKSDSLAISIVGSRRCSIYGKEQASKLAHFLAAAGFTIVSGMARGIDTAAHHGALSARGRTIAVQGCGLSIIFPPENDKLFEMICQSGACMSELPLGYEPLAENFPSRNRIIAGLSLGTIIVEAAPRSGALITARMAMENNREVMAVPGKVDSPLSKGPHKLIKDGATLVESVEDVIESLGHLSDQLIDHVTNAAKEAQEKAETAQAELLEKAKLTLAENELAIYKSLDKTPIHIEEIIDKTKLPAGRINAGLVSLQLKGLVKQSPGNMFMKR